MSGEETGSGGGDEMGRWENGRGTRVGKFALAE